MKRLLNIALLSSFLLTILVPLTGINLHKLASVIFLLLTAVHALVYRKGLGVRRWLLLALVVVSFLTGFLGVILDRYPLVLILHRVISIAVVFFTAIHIFVFHKRLRSGSRAR